jgi:hypothetical protein
MAWAFRQIALLVSQMREWAKTHNVKNTELAGMLGLTPQGVTEIFRGRNQPTGEQVLRSRELGEL